MLRLRTFSSAPAAEAVLPHARTFAAPVMVLPLRIRPLPARANHAKGYNHAMDAAESIAPELLAEPAPDAVQVANCAGGSRELLTLALPLVVSQSFMTVQVFVDTILLAWHDPREMAASFPAVMWYWLPFGLLQVTAGYVSTFVAQYTGAGRPERVGPAVWQGIHFAVLAGLLVPARWSRPPRT